jgi:hypothetical protein
MGMRIGKQQFFPILLAGRTIFHFRAVSLAAKLGKVFRPNGPDSLNGWFRLFFGGMKRPFEF